MKEQASEKKNRGILWRVLLVFAALVFAAVLELGKHTIAGWILTAAAVCAFIIIRIRVLSGRKRSVRLLAWLALFSAFTCILWISWPPYRNIPAVQGKSAGVTDIIVTLLRREIRTGKDCLSGLRLTGLLWCRNSGTALNM